MEDILVNFNGDQLDVVNYIRKICIKYSIKSYIVGGAIRDSILNKEIKDIDICIDENPKKLIKYINCIKKYEYYDKFQTATILFDNDVSIDLIRCRKEIYNKNGELPVIIPSYIYDDLYRRDFTVNAIAYDMVENLIIDPFGGMENLYSKKLEKIHENSYVEDPTRIFRAVRYSVRYFFKIDDIVEIRDSIDKGSIDTISNDRIVKELYIMCREEKWISNLITCCWLKIFNLDLKNLGTPIILQNYSYNDVNLRVLNLFFCIKEPKFKQILIDNSILDKKLRKCMKYYYNSEATKSLSHTVDNYEIYKMLNNVDEYLLVLMGWNKKIKYKVLNYVQNLNNINLTINGRYLKDIGIRDGKFMGRILKYMLKIKLDTRIVDEKKYLVENLGEIKDVFKY